MTGDEPPYLTVGTDVSAKYKGAFCEAKIKKVVRSVKCKVNFKNNNGSALVTDDLVRGTLRVGAHVEAKHPEKNQYLEGIVNKLHDYSQYTVVFDDGDETTLRRTSLCLKSGRHFAESETLDQLPLTHPEHFGTPVMGIKGGRKRRILRRSPMGDASSDDETPPPMARKKEASKPPKDPDPDTGKVVCVDVVDKKKQARDNWFPGLVVSPGAQEAIRIKAKVEYLVRSFKDGKYHVVVKKDAREFTREIGSKVDNNTLKTAVERAMQYVEKDELPPHWDRESLFRAEYSSNDGNSDQDSDSDVSDDEPSEAKDRFVAQLYKFMDDRGTPINKAPSVSNRDLNLYKLFKVVQKSGGYNRVTNQMQWKSVYTKLGLPTANSSASHQIKQAYKKYLHSFEGFERKLGCTMGTSTRSGRVRHRSERNLMVTRDRHRDFKSAARRKKDAKYGPDDKLKTSDVDVKVESVEKSQDEADVSSEKVEDSVPIDKIPSEVNQQIKKERILSKVIKDTESKSSDTEDDRKSKGPPRSIEDSKRDERRRGRKKLIKMEKPDDDDKSQDSDDDEEESTCVGLVSMGDKVRVKYGRGRQQKIYEAKVLKTDTNDDNDRIYFVHYTGWNMRYDEWVKRHRIVENLTQKIPEKRFRQSSSKFKMLTSKRGRPHGSFSSGSKLGGGGLGSHSSSSSSGPPNKGGGRDRGGGSRRGGSVTRSRTTRSETRNSGAAGSPNLFPNGLEPQRRHGGDKSSDSSDESESDNESDVDVVVRRTRGSAKRDEDVADTSFEEKDKYEFVDDDDDQMVAAKKSGEASERRVGSGVKSAKLVVGRSRIKKDVDASTSKAIRKSGGGRRGPGGGSDDDDDDDDDTKAKRKLRGKSSLSSTKPVEESTPNAKKVERRGRKKKQQLQQPPAISDDDDSDDIDKDGDDNSQNEGVMDSELYFFESSKKDTATTSEAENESSVIEDSEGCFVSDVMAAAAKSSSSGVGGGAGGDVSETDFTKHEEDSSFIDVASSLFKPLDNEQIAGITTGSSISSKEGLLLGATASLDIKIEPEVAPATPVAASLPMLPNLDKEKDEPAVKSTLDASAAPVQSTEYKTTKVMATTSQADDVEGRIKIELTVEKETTAKVKPIVPVIPRPEVPSTTSAATSDNSATVPSASAPTSASAAILPVTSEPVVAAVTSVDVLVQKKADDKQPEVGQPPDPLFNKDKDKGVGEVQKVLQDVKPSSRPKQTTEEKEQPAKPTPKSDFAPSASPASVAIISKDDVAPELEKKQIPQVEQTQQNPLMEKCPPSSEKTLGRVVVEDKSSSSSIVMSTGKPIKPEMIPALLPGSSSLSSTTMTTTTTTDSSEEDAAFQPTRPSERSQEQMATPVAFIKEPPPPPPAPPVVLDKFDALLRDIPWRKSSCPTPSEVAAPSSSSSTFKDVKMDIVVSSKTLSKKDKSRSSKQKNKKSEKRKASETDTDDDLVGADDEVVVAAAVAEQPKTKKRRSKEVIDVAKKESTQVQKAQETSSVASTSSPVKAKSSSSSSKKSSKERKRSKKVQETAGDRETVKKSRRKECKRKKVTLERSSRSGGGGKDDDDASSVSSSSEMMMTSPTKKKDKKTSRKHAATVAVETTMPIVPSPTTSCSKKKYGGGSGGGVSAKKIKSSEEQQHTSDDFKKSSRKDKDKEKDKGKSSTKRKDKNQEKSSSKKDSMLLLQQLQMGTQLSASDDSNSSKISGPPASASETVAGFEPIGGLDDDSRQMVAITAGASASSEAKSDAVESGECHVPSYLICEEDVPASPVGTPDVNASSLPVACGAADSEMSSSSSTVEASGDVKPPALASISSTNLIVTSLSSSSATAASFSSAPQQPPRMSAFTPVTSTQKQNRSEPSSSVSASSSILSTAMASSATPTTTMKLESAEAAAAASTDKAVVESPSHSPLRDAIDVKSTKLCNQSSSSLSGGSSDADATVGLVDDDGHGHGGTSSSSSSGDVDVDGEKGCSADKVSTSSKRLVTTLATSAAPAITPAASSSTEDSSAPTTKRRRRNYKKQAISDSTTVVDLPPRRADLIGMDAHTSSRHRPAINKPSRNSENEEFVHMADMFLGVANSTLHSHHHQQQHQHHPMVATTMTTTTTHGDAHARMFSTSTLAATTVSVASASTVPPSPNPTTALAVQPQLQLPPVVPRSPPKPSKFNFYTELDDFLDGSERIAVLQDRLTELRRTYLSLKAELACIDRRRKKLKRKEKEVSGKTIDSLLFPPCSSSSIELFQPLPWLLRPFSPLPPSSVPHAFSTITFKFKKVEINGSASIYVKSK